MRGGYSFSFAQYLTIYICTDAKGVTIDVFDSIVPALTKSFDKLADEFQEFSDECKFNLKNYK